MSITLDIIDNTPLVDNKILNFNAPCNPGAFSTTIARTENSVVSTPVPLVDTSGDNLSPTAFEVDETIFVKYEQDRNQYVLQSVRAAAPAFITNGLLQAGYTSSQFGDRLDINNDFNIPNGLTVGYGNNTGINVKSGVLINNYFKVESSAEDLYIGDPFVENSNATIHIGFGTLANADLRYARHFDIPSRTNISFNGVDTVITGIAVIQQSIGDIVVLDLVDNENTGAPFPLRRASATVTALDTVTVHNVNLVPLATKTDPNVYRVSIIEQHRNSVAIGNLAEITDDNQIVLGAAGSTTLASRLNTGRFSLGDATPIVRQQNGGDPSTAANLAELRARTGAIHDTLIRFGFITDNS